MAASLDHAVWFHAPVRADDWFLYETDSPAATGGLALCFGQIWAADGTHVATVAQEGLIRSLERLETSSGSSEPWPASVLLAGLLLPPGWPALPPAGARSASWRARSASRAASRSAAAAAKSAASQSWFSRSSAQTRSTCARVVVGEPMATRRTASAADRRVGQEHLRRRR